MLPFPQSAQVLFRDHKAHSPCPALPLHRTGVNRSHVQQSALGSSCLPFVSLTSMFPFACMRMYRLWISDLTMRKQRDRARLICLSLDLNCTALVSNLNNTYQMLRNLLEVMLCDSATQLLQPILPALFHDQNAISPFPASTTWNLSQVQPEGSSSLPLWPLPSMLPLSRRRMKRLWCLHLSMRRPSKSSFKKACTLHQIHCTQ